jgi:hypothetical protein
VGAFCEPPGSGCGDPEGGENRCFHDEFPMCRFQGCRRPVAIGKRGLGVVPLIPDHDEALDIETDLDIFPAANNYARMNHSRFS